MDLKRGIDKGLKIVLKEINKMSKEIKMKEEIKQVATISANGDEEIGALISDLIEKVGNTGAITVEEGKTLKHEVEFVKGLKFGRGYMSPFFVNNQKENTCEMENPYILLVNHKISTL